MNAEKMISKIQTKMTDDERLKIMVAKSHHGYTRIDNYLVTKHESRFIGHTYRGYGNLRDTYKKIYLGR